MAVALSKFITPTYAGTLSLVVNFVPLQPAFWQVARSKSRDSRVKYLLEVVGHNRSEVFCRLMIPLSEPNLYDVSDPLLFYFGILRVSCDLP